MNIYDILGPVMVGPSSSHTAGAVRIGLITRRLLGAAPVHAEISLSGSFAATGTGHGTDRALIAGLLGMQPDDIRIPDSFSFAAEAGLTFTFHKINPKGRTSKYRHSERLFCRRADSGGTGRPHLAEAVFWLISLTVFA